MTKHAPGPWKYDGNRGTIRTADGEVLTVTGVAIPTGRVLPDDVCHANARLIADAPELLELCQELLGPMIVWSQYWASMYNGGKLSPAHEEIIQRASIVIARNTSTENAE